MRLHNTHDRDGFTLLELSIVIVLIAAIIGSVAVVFSAVLQKRQRDETYKKLEAIQLALYDYRVAYNELPCPADVTMTLTNTSFGIAAANKGVCTGGVPAANFVNAGGTPQDPRGGMVPTRTLNLPDDFAFDGWGRRFFYFVNRDMTLSGAMNNINGIDPTPRMTINNEHGVPNTSLAAYVVLSAGPNGHGAYPRAGGAARVISGSVNTDEWNNCDCDASVASTGLDGEFVQADSTENPANLLDEFDDIVIYATRVDMILKSSMSWNLGPQFVYRPEGGDGGGGLPGGGTSGGGGPGGGEDPICTDLRGSACFPAGTLISTPRGEVPIEQLSRDDMVFGVEASGRVRMVKVVATIQKQSALLRVKTDRGTLVTTAEHPLWRGGEEFTPAAELKAGDQVMLRKAGKITSATVQQTEADDNEQAVYNLEVEDPHTFIADDFVVHNKKVCEVIRVF